MADLKPISQFATASSVEANTLLFVSTPNQNNGYDSEKVSASELGEALVNDFEYTQDLQTAEKTITGGINELKAINGYSYDAYDDTTTSANAYSVGDLVIYNNTLYRCKATTYGAWDSTKWELTSIADEISRIDTALSNDIIPQLPFYIASHVATTNSSGEIFIPYSTIGITTKPPVVLAMQEFNTSTVFKYDYDNTNATDGVKLIAYDVASGNAAGGRLLRFGVIVFKTANHID